MFYEILFTICIITSLIFMTDTVYLDNELMFETCEVYDVIPECFLSAKIVGRSFQYHPHSYLWEIHRLFVLLRIFSHLFASFEWDGGHGEIVANTQIKSPPYPLENFCWNFKGEFFCNYRKSLPCSSDFFWEKFKGKFFAYAVSVEHFQLPFQEGLLAFVEWRVLVAGMV